MAASSIMHCCSIVNIVAWIVPISLSSSFFFLSAIIAPRLSFALIFAFEMDTCWAICCATPARSGARRERRGGRGGADLLQVRLALLQPPDVRPHRLKRGLRLRLRTKRRMR